MNADLILSHLLILHNYLLNVMIFYSSLGTLHEEGISILKAYHAAEGRVRSLHEYVLEKIRIDDTNGGQPRVASKRTICQSII